MLTSFVLINESLIAPLVTALIWTLVGVDSKTKNILVQFFVSN